MSSDASSSRCIGGAAAAWPLAARAAAERADAAYRCARVAERRRSGGTDPIRGIPSRAAAIRLGSRPQHTNRGALGRNRGDDTRKSAAELISLAPDVILATGSAGTGPLLQATRSIPIVFVHTPDPVGAGYVKSMSRPGGNATGFINFEYGLGAKWLELLKQIMPNTTRAAIVRDPAITAGIGMWGAIQAAAPSLGIDVIPVNIHEAGEVERAIADFARSANGGLVVTGSGLAVTHRGLIVSLAARHRLPAVYFERFFVDAGGLVSYGADLVEQYRQAAGYVDRILKGEKPADLPVQAPTKYELVINLKTAKALGLDVPDTLLARADEVIE